MDQKTSFGKEIKNKKMWKEYRSLLLLAGFS